MAISSSDWRARVAPAAPIWYLVPDSVVRYVAKRGLYREFAADAGTDTRPAIGAAPARERETLDALPDPEPGAPPRRRRPPEESRP